MYLKLWRLKAFPFANVNDENSFFLSAGAEEALASIFYAISSVRPFALLTGSSGVGKSMLLKVAGIELASKQCEVARVQAPADNARELFGQILSAFDMPAEPPLDYTHMFATLVEFGQVTASRGVRPVIFIDDAQTLCAPESLDKLRLLANFQKGGDFLFTGILAGTDAVVEVLRQVPALADRIEIRTRLTPFTEEETSAYITAKLEVAGATEKIFAANELARIYEQTEGVARDINALCDKAMTHAFMRGVKTVDADALDAAVTEFAGSRSGLSDEGGI